MTRIGRNEKCPCGSGKKYKRCCGFRRINNQVEIVITSGDDEVTLVVKPDGRKRTSSLGIPLDLPIQAYRIESYAAYHMGKFGDVLEIFDEFIHHGEPDELSIRVAYLAAAARAETHVPKSVQAMLEGKELLWKKIHDEHPLEELWFSLNAFTEAVEQTLTGLESLLLGASTGLYILPTSHPTLCLLIAHWLLDKTNRIDLALSLVNCCLGWRYVYRRIEDLLSLAKLLHRLGTPKLFWTSIGNLYFDYMYLDSTEQLTLMNSFSYQGQSSRVHPAQLCASQKHTNRIEGEFHQFCVDHGFPEALALSDMLHEAFGLAEGRDRHLVDKFKSTKTYEEKRSIDWLEKKLFAMRHPWFVLLEVNEQNFIRNGDMAFVNCDTGDYSMACSQWWRAIESVLKRKLIIPVGQHLDANPAWVEQDRQYAASLAPEQELEWERLFVRELADPHRRNRMTLTHMLLVIQKCLSDVRKAKEVISMVRRYSGEFMSQSLSEFRWINSELDEYADMRSAISPNVLTEQAIQSYRNAASHDAALDFKDAVVGRLLAIRILDFMHYPRYCVSTKLEELKQELAAKRDQQVS